MELEFVDVLLAAVVGIVCWCAIHRLKQIGEPGFKTWPLIGATVDLLANKDRYYDWVLWNMQVKKRDTMPIPIGSMNDVYTVDPAVLEDVLKTNFANYPKGKDFHEKMEPLLGNGIFNSDGHQWKIQRKTASHEFSSRVLREFSTNIFRDHAIVLAKIVESGRAEQKPLEMQDLFQRMSLDTICTLGFGVELGFLSPDLPNNEFAVAFDRCNMTTSQRFVDPLWRLKRFLRIGDEGALPGFVKTIDGFTYGIISQRRQQLQNPQQKKDDLLSRYMLLDDNFSDKDLRDYVINFLLAGRDSTGSTLTSFTWMIASHPECERKLLEELDDFEKTHSGPGGPESSDKSLSFEERLHKFASLLNFSSLQELPYMHAAINETLRLFPAVPADSKGVDAPAVLPDGTRVKPGDLVSYFPYGMGRSESLWGPDAAEFRPERWKTSNGDWDFNVSPFKFSAFQAGPRICLGKESAYLQLKTTAAILYRFFKFELVPDQSFKYRLMATLILVNGLQVKVKGV